MKIIQKVVLAFLFGLSLGCASWVADPTPEEKAYQAHRSVERALNEQGVRILRIGETVRLIIPSDDLFYPHSFLLIKRANLLIHLIEQYIKFYQTIRIEVAVYAAGISRSTLGAQCQDKLWARMLTQRRADAIVEKMSKHDIDTRLLVANGYGHSCKVKCDGNERIEVRFYYTQIS